MRFGNRWKWIMFEVDLRVFLWSSRNQHFSYLRLVIFFLMSHATFSLALVLSYKRSQTKKVTSFIRGLRTPNTNSRLRGQYFSTSTLPPLRWPIESDDFDNFCLIAISRVLYYIKPTGRDVELCQFISLLTIF